MPIYFEFVLNVTLSYHGNNRKVNEKKNLVPVPLILCITLLVYITSKAHICQNIYNISILYLISYQPVFKNFQKDISGSLCVWFVSEFEMLCMC